MILAIHGIPLYIDELVNHIYLVDLPRMSAYDPYTHYKKHVIGSTQAFGELMAWNLAMAYYPRRSDG